MAQINVGKVFERLLNEAPKKINLIRGGTRSGKTYSLSQHFALWLITGTFCGVYIKADTVYVVRKTLPSLRNTVLKDFINVLHTLGYYNRIHYNKTQIIISYKNRFINFIPADDPEKLKGLDPGITWINEADSVEFDAFIQLNLRTRRYLFADYNPSNPESWCKMLEDEWLPKRADMRLDISTFHDNPFLPDTTINEIKQLEHLDKELFEVYNKGNWAALTGIILNFEVVEEMPTVGRELYGLDFGFTDPTVIVRVLILGNDLYVEEVLYQNKLTTDEISYTMNVKGVKGRVFADSAAAQQIADLRSKGHRIKPAVKGKDSIVNGIKRLKQFNIYVTEGSTNIIREFKRYKWQQNQHGDFVEKPVPMYDHCADALRYSVSRLNKKRFII